MRVVVVVALALLVAAPAAAQQVEIEKPAPPPGRRERAPAVIAPGLSGEGRPIDADNYPKGGRVPSRPAVIGQQFLDQSPARLDVAREEIESADGSGGFPDGPAMPAT